MRKGVQIEIAVVAFALATLVLVAIALMDLVRRPPKAWAASGTRRETWIAILILSVMLPLPGIAGPVIYLGPVRRKLKRASGPAASRGG